MKLKISLEFFKKAFSEADGAPSSIRVLTAFTVVLFTLALIITQIWTLLFYSDLIVAVAVILAGVITSALGIKAYQKGKENSE